jgi:predicted transcriptional regulator
MPTLHDGQIAIDFGGNSPISRSNSLSGAKVAVTRANSQKARILVRLLECGPQTDSQVALALGLPEARISARRSPMVKDGLIAALDSVKAPSGAMATRWDLTVRGVHVAGHLRSEVTR